MPVEIAASTIAPPVTAPSYEDALADVNALKWSAQLAQLKRFYRQPYWEDESTASEAAAEIEGPLRLESVADHSWKLADAVLLLAGRFRQVDYCRATQLALLHDKLELITGDHSPIDEDASGCSTHAFNPEIQLQKRHLELQALGQYLRILPPHAREMQEQLLREYDQMATPEANFVHALDKLCALLFVLERKQVKMEPEHVDFTLRYVASGVQHFPSLANHYNVLAHELESRHGRQHSWTRHE